MSVILVLVAVLVLGFLAVAFVGFFGWRMRIRNHAVGPVVFENHRRAARARHA